MEIIKLRKILENQIETFKNQGKSIGFVPTMGALHRGHLTLVEIASKVCDVVVVSIFVNPSQFNDSDDFQRYPRNLQKDIEMLQQTQCKTLFIPSTEEIYPEPDTRIFDLGNLDKVMEGAFRPGHFNGVAQVVSRLFEIVKPHKAFFGEKDFQQIAIIKEMLKKYNFNIEIVACPIVRESDGLAMSSRNLLLSAKQRNNASIIFRTLFNSKKLIDSNNIENTKKFVIDAINEVEEFDVEYFEIVDGNSLQSICCWDTSNYVVGCIAVFVGNTRLIDNVIYKNE